MTEEKTQIGVKFNDGFDLKRFVGWKVFDQIKSITDYQLIRPDDELFEELELLDAQEWKPVKESEVDHIIEFDIALPVAARVSELSSGLKVLIQPKSAKEYWFRSLVGNRGQANVTCKLETVQARLANTTFREMHIKLSDKFAIKGVAEKLEVLGKKNSEWVWKCSEVTDYATKMPSRISTASEEIQEIFKDISKISKQRCLKPILDLISGIEIDGERTLSLFYCQDEVPNLWKDEDFDLNEEKLAGLLKWVLERESGASWSVYLYRTPESHGHVKKRKILLGTQLITAASTFHDLRKCNYEVEVRSLLDDYWLESKKIFDTWDDPKHLNERSSRGFF